MAGIFKAYDIRGIYGETLTDDKAYGIAKSFVLAENPKQAVVGYDSRNSNQAMFKAFTTGLREAGVDVVDIGLVSRSMLNWVAMEKNYEYGVMITASHNPKQYNGFKIIQNKGEGIRFISYDQGLDKIEEIYNSDLWKKHKPEAKGKITSKNYLEDFTSFLAESAEIKRASIILDTSNGTAGPIMKEVLEKLKIKFELINGEPDGNFPGHDPNPLHEGSMAELGRQVRKKKADLGVIMDPDGDRVLFTDEKGKPVFPNFVAALLAENLEGEAVVHDLISSKVVPETILASGKKPYESKVGYANLMKVMEKHNAFLGCESSGHYLWEEMHYIDSAEFTALKVIKILSNSETKFSKLVNKYDKYHRSGEINLEVEDKEKALKKIESKFKKHVSSKLDGVTVKDHDGWFNARPSNTEPLLRIRAEAETKEKLQELIKEVSETIGVPIHL